MATKIGCTAIVAALSACSQAPFLSPAQSPTVPAGYVCTLAPTTAFSPGYVYRQTQSGEAFLVEEILVTPRAFEVALGGYSATFNTSGGLTANLRDPIGGVLGDANIGGGATRTSNISFDDGRFLLMTDGEEKQAIQAALAAIGIPRPGERYFIVRDVVQAKGIKMSLSSQDTRQLGGQASIAQLVSLTPNLSVIQGQTLDLSGTFQNPLNVCIRAVELMVSNQSAGPVPVGDPVLPPGRAYASPSDVISIFNARTLPSD